MMTLLMRRRGVASAGHVVESTLHARVIMEIGNLINYSFISLLTLAFQFGFELKSEKVLEFWQPSGSGARI